MNTTVRFANAGCTSAGLWVTSGRSTRSARPRLHGGRGPTNSPTLYNLGQHRVHRAWRSLGVGDQRWCNSRAVSVFRPHVKGSCYQCAKYVHTLVKCSIPRACNDGAGAFILWLKVWSTFNTATGPIVGSTCKRYHQCWPNRWASVFKQAIVTWFVRFQLVCLGL